MEQGQQPTRRPEAEQDVYEQFVVTMRQFGVEYQKREPVIAAFFESAEQALDQLPAYRQLVSEYLAEEDVRLPAYRVNKFFKAHQALLMDDERRFTLGYPYRFAVNDTWLQFMQDSFAVADTPAYETLVDTLRYPDQKNRSDRAKAPALIAAGLMMRQSLGGDMVFHEYGASNGHVLKALALQEIDRPVIVGNLEDQAMDAARTGLFALATANVPFAAGIRVDTNPPATEADVARVKAYSLYPSELNERHENLFDTLALSNPARPIQSIKGDFMALSGKERRALLRRPADVVFMSHVLSQNADRLDQVFEAVLPFIKPRGIIVVNEYAEVAPRDHIVTIVPDWPKPWSCLTAVMEALHPEEGLYPLVSWESSHCQKGMLHEEELGRFAMLDVFLNH